MQKKKKKKKPKIQNLEHNYSFRTSKTKTREEYTNYINMKTRQRCEFMSKQLNTEILEWKRMGNEDAKKVLIGALKANTVQITQTETDEWRLILGKDLRQSMLKQCQQMDQYLTGLKQRKDKQLDDYLAVVNKICEDEISKNNL